MVRFARSNEPCGLSFEPHGTLFLEMDDWEQRGLKPR
jgi:hypothetical protein